MDPVAVEVASGPNWRHNGAVSRGLSLQLQQAALCGQRVIKCE